MRLPTLLVVFSLVFACVNGFMLPQARGFALRPLTRPTFQVLRAAEGETIPATKENVESVAGVTGGVLGLIVLHNFWLSVGLAAVSLYVSKKDNDGGEAVRGVAKAVLDGVNFVTRLNSKFDVTGKVVGKVTEVVDSNESEAVVKVKEVIGKVSEVNSQYGLLDKGKEAIGAAAKLSGTALEKAEDLNSKYDFVSIAKNAAAAAAEKAKELAAKSSSE